MIYLLVILRVQGVSWHALGSWVVRKQEKNGEFFICDSSYLWAYSSEENALYRCHQFLFIQSLLAAFCLHRKFPLTNPFTFLSRSIHPLSPEHNTASNKGSPWYFWTNTPCRVWRISFFPSCLLSVSTPWDSTSQPANKIYVTLLGQAFSSWHRSQQLDRVGHYR